MKQWNKEEIRQLRLLLGLKQREFAEVIGTTREYVTKLETGKKKPSLVLKRLFDCLEEKYKRGLNYEKLQRHI
jgi:DNA-binding transcriptional regulator YiaG